MRTERSLFSCIYVDYICMWTVPPKRTYVGRIYSIGISVDNSTSSHQYIGEHTLILNDAQKYDDTGVNI